MGSGCWRPAPPNGLPAGPRAWCPAEPASNDDGPPIGAVAALLSGEIGSGSVDGTAGSDSPGVPSADPVPRAMLLLPAGRNCTENGAWLAGAGTRATSYVPPCACSDGSSLNTIVDLSVESVPAAERSQLYAGLVDQVPALAGTQVPRTGQATTAGVPTAVLGATFSVSVAETLAGSTGTSSIVPGTTKRTAATALGPVGSPPTSRLGPVTASTGKDWGACCASLHHPWASGPIVAALAAPANPSVCAISTAMTPPIAHTPRRVIVSSSAG
jgi:hypothetical protein